MALLKMASAAEQHHPVAPDRPQSSAPRNSYVGKADRCPGRVVNDGRTTTYKRAPETPDTRPAETASEFIVRPCQRSMTSNHSTAV